MTNDLLLIGVLIIIGAIIGGGTNIIAIRMLFRPYEAKYIGSFKLPFTPGLIPKRRSEIAISLGKTVEDHLVTPEGIQEKLKDGLLLKEAEDRLSLAVKELLKEELTLDEWLELHLDKKDQLKNIRQSIELGLETKLLGWIEEYKNIPLKESVPKQWHEKMNATIPSISASILKKTEEYLHTDEGRVQMEEMVSRFFNSRGGISNMLGKMANRFSLSSALTNELVRFLNEKHTEQLLTNLLQKEWEQVISNSPSNYISDENVSTRVQSLSKAVVDQLPLVGEWDKPLEVWSHQYEKILQKTVVPYMMTSAATILSRYIKSIIKRIGIREIVTTEVNGFPLQKLEEMLLDIAKRELKLIAVLGALIGALVGLVQGIVIVFFV
ncbi:DUF445 domain-containing protein [Salipaludibacillus sp. CF4.18]|uniref:DUF445 domain-containing protein n=1 Tax=Salipaludibacillus sp. CF4.18 TaxID=3373081 RepID=UPI003EE55E18